MEAESEPDRAGSFRLKLSPAQEKTVRNLTPEQKKLWEEMVEAWESPRMRLVLLEDEIERSGPVPTFHIPTAEGVATYRGLFGGNGRLSEEDRQLVVGLLHEAIGADSEPEQLSPPAAGDEADTDTESS